MGTAKVVALGRQEKKREELKLSINEKLWEN